jgi:exopolysaccharide biosynthesis polyprenyl glycosylphosphotransferase
MNENRQILKYVISDIIAALIAWTSFYIFRKVVIEPSVFGYKIPIEFDTTYYLALFIIPVFWTLLYYFSGHYRNIYRRSRLHELGQTFFASLLGAIILFFIAILDDTVHSYTNYYKSFVTLFSLQFILTYVPRLIITSRMLKNIEKGKIGFNTILIGSNEPAVETYKEMINQHESSGNRFLGFISINSTNGFAMAKHIPHLGSYDNLIDVIKTHNIEEVIIAIDPSEHEQINMILNKLNRVNVIVKAIPSLNDLITGRVRLSTLFGTPLVEISRDLMPIWQVNLKNFLDKALSIFALALLSPLCLVLSIAIKLSSKGPVLYSHERIGRYSKPFKIFKFRSMYNNAEKNGPELSSRHDQRITTIGRFMRKYRLDEIPNFINVLMGDMSLVGPRPERKYYIDKIIQKAPHYIHLQKVKPGITSWGQIKYGYAENVDQMIKRLRFDLLYVENMSIYLDFKILIYTALIILKGRGV